LAHAVVLREKEQGKLLTFQCSEYWMDLLAGKRWSEEKLTSRLEEGTNALKSVYRFKRVAFEFITFSDICVVNCLLMIWWYLLYWSMASMGCGITASLHLEFLSNPCLRSRQKQSERCLIDLRVNGSLVNTSTTENVPR
jgi:hypothetical protein